MDFDFISANAENRPKSRLGFARYLHSLDSSRTTKGWEMLLMRWEQAGSPTTNPERIDVNEREAPLLTADWLHDSRYIYNSEEDVYYTRLPRLNNLISVPGQTHRDMLADYSNATGPFLSCRQLAEKYSFPLKWMQSYARVHGWSHDGDPFTSEDLDTKNSDDLQAQMLQHKRNSIIESYNQEEKEQQVKDAAAYRDLKHRWLDDFKDLIPNKKAKLPKINLKSNARPYALVISPTDFHWGKYGWADETGDGYDLETARSRLFDKTNELISRLPGKPEEIILAAGSDWFHVDNDLGTTTKGTPQDMCASPAQILMSGCDLAREHIDLLRQVAPIRITFMAGNHDRHSTTALMMYLSAYYKDDDDITVITSPKTRQYLTYGTTLLGFTHGDKVRENKLGPLMSSESREEWGTHPHHVWFHGHLHHQTLVERDGCTIIQLPSLAGHDRYHYRGGYTINNPGLAAHIIDKEHGLVGSLFAIVEHDNS